MSGDKETMKENVEEREDMDMSVPEEETHEDSESIEDSIQEVSDYEEEIDQSNPVIEKKLVHKKRKIIGITLGSIVACVFVFALGVNFYLDYLVDKVNVLDPSKKLEYFPSETEEPEISDDPTTTDTPNQVIEQIHQQMDDNTMNNGLNGVLDEDYVYNVMLLGSDTRNEKAVGNTDAVILLSINKVTKKIYITSFMRDSYVTIPNYYKSRINTAFKKGPEVLFETMLSNFNIRVDKFVYINFFSFIDVIDELGGIEVDISKAEMKAMNKNFAEINHYLGAPEDDGVMTAYGVQNLSGKQALAYSRVRYLTGNDFARTERQRLVLEKMIAKVRNCNILELTGIADKVLELVTTNIPKSEIKSLLIDSISYLSYDVEQLRVPANGTYTGLEVRGDQVLGIDFKENIKYIGENIYGKVYEEEDKKEVKNN